MKLNMELDTGSAISAISDNLANKYFSKLKLFHTTLVLKFYDGTLIKPLGYLFVKVRFKDIILN